MPCFFFYSPTFIYLTIYTLGVVSVFADLSLVWIVNNMCPGHSLTLLRILYWNIHVFYYFCELICINTLLPFHVIDLIPCRILVLNIRDRKNAFSFVFFFKNAHLKKCLSPFKNYIFPFKNISVNKLSKALLWITVQKRKNFKLKYIHS